MTQRVPIGVVLMSEWEYGCVGCWSLCELSLLVDEIVTRSMSIAFCGFHSCVLLR
jgi:hypothetical protein